MISIKTTPTKLDAWCFCMPRQIPKDPQISPVRLLVSRWRNHTPEPLKCEVGQKRGVYERDRANDKDNLHQKERI